MLPEISTGMIVSWSGSIVSIPSGWALCDGNNGTPNLTDKFIVGAGSTYSPNDNSSVTTHDHTFEGDGHTHEIAFGTGISIGAEYDTNTGSETIAGTTDTGTSLARYYSLAYIMKL